MKSRLLIFTMFLLVATFSCSNGQNDNSEESKDETVQKPIYLIRFDSPQNGILFTLGEPVDLALKLADANNQPDSIILFVNEAKMEKLSGLNYTLSTQNLKLGTQSIKATAWKGGQRQTASVTILLKSKVKPLSQTYRVVKTFPHDPYAYTQGLIYHEGFLYEGTGQNGASSLRKVELETGKVLQSDNLSRDYFGEGIALLDGKIYQLTWTSGVGFVYDFETFKSLHTFNYNTQGWGLTTNGTDLIMSDGSNTIYFMEPQSFTELHRIEVFDDKGPVKMLNELEYIDGKIYANVYLTDRVVVIDPESGAVISSIDFNGILKPSDRTGNEDVLNGIAYDADNKRLFVTGKYWPKLFQVEIVNR